MVKVAERGKHGWWLMGVTEKVREKVKEGDKIERKRIGENIKGKEKKMKERKELWMEAPRRENEVKMGA